MGLYQKRDLGQFSQSDCKQITLREAMLRKYKADLKQKEAARKRQQKFCVHQKRQIKQLKKKPEQNFQKSCKKKKKT